MEIVWHGHSCFSMTARGYAVVLDPYRPGMVPGLGRLDLVADAVLCSHEHGDHNFREAVRVRVPSVPSPFVIRRLASFHDDAQGARRGANVITLLETDDLRIAHLGDLGCVPEPDQLALLHAVDVLMVPVGGYYTIDAVTAKRLCDDLAARVIVPMHYRGAAFGPAVLDPVERFLERFDPRSVRRLTGNAFTVDPTGPRVVVVPSLPR